MRASVLRDYPGAAAVGRTMYFSRSAVATRALPEARTDGRLAWGSEGSHRARRPGAGQGNERERRSAHRGRYRRHVHRRGGAPPRRAGADHENPQHAPRPEHRGARGARAHGDGLGISAAPGEALRPRHHGRDQRGARAQGRARRTDHHARLPRRARDRPPDAPSDVRSGARPGDADFSRARPLPPRGPRADRPGRRGAGAARRGGGRGGRRRLGLVRRAGDRRRLSVLLSQRRARAPRPRDHRGAASRPVRLAVLRGRSGLPRIRAHGGHGVRCLCEAGGGPLSRQSRRRPRRRGGSGAPANHAVARRNFRLAT